MESRAPRQDDPIIDSPVEDCSPGREDAESILRSINRSFQQVNLAAEFLLLQDDPKHAGQELQLACLIRDRIARIEEQVSELYRVLNRPPYHRHEPTRHPALLQ